MSETINPALLQHELSRRALRGPRVKGFSNYPETAVDTGGGLPDETTPPRAFEEINQPEEQLRVMIDTIPALAWTCQPDGAAEFLNRRWLDYTGCSLREALGWGWKAAIHPDDLEKLMNAWLRPLDPGEPGEVEARLRRFDGEL